MRMVRIMNKVKEYNISINQTRDDRIMKNIRRNLKTRMSTKGQVVIPKVIREQVNTVDFIVEYDKGIIKLTPVHEEDKFFDFTGDVVRELVNEGYGGKKLKDELVKRKEMIDKAFITWIDEVENNDVNLISTQEIKQKRRGK